MTLVASFTKSYKEAQTWMSVVLLAPTMPILIVSILMVSPHDGAHDNPVIEPAPAARRAAEKNEPLNWLHVAVSVSGTLLAGALLTLLCARLYRREGLLG